MRVVTFLVPGSGMIPSDVIAKIAMELHTVSTNGDISVNQWDVDQPSVISDTPTIDIAIKNAACVLRPFDRGEAILTAADIAVALKTVQEPEVLENAVKLVATCSKPMKLIQFGLSKTAIKACKDLYNSGYIS